MFLAQAMVSAVGVSETSHGAAMSIALDDPTSIRILSELNLLAVCGMIWLLHVN